MSKINLISELAKFLFQCLVFNVNYRTVQITTFTFDGHFCVLWLLDP